MAFVPIVQLVINKVSSAKPSATNVPNLRNPNQIQLCALLVQSINIQSSKTVVVQPAKVARFILEVPIWQATVQTVHQVPNLMVLLLVSRAERTISTSILGLIAKLVH